MIPIVNMELKDTVDMMLSNDYKERFKAEYYQTQIRYQNLHRIVIKHEAGTLGFELDTPIERLKHQKSMMGQYLFDLEVRAEIKGIDLNWW